VSSSTPRRLAALGSLVRDPARTISRNTPAGVGARCPPKSRAPDTAIGSGSEDARLRAFRWAASSKLV